MRRDFSFETTSLKECLVASAAAACIVAVFWLVGTGRAMPTCGYATLIAASASCAAFVARRIWLVMHQRGLEWRRLDRALFGAWQAMMAVAFCLQFFSRLAPR